MIIFWQGELPVISNCTQSDSLEPVIPRLANHIKDLRYQGTPLNPSNEHIIALNNFNNCFRNDRMSLLSILSSGSEFPRGFGREITKSVLVSSRRKANDSAAGCGDCLILIGSDLAGAS
jgi:hypothetical protein